MLFSICCTDLLRKVQFKGLNSLRELNLKRRHLSKETRQSSTDMLAALEGCAQAQWCFDSGKLVFSLFLKPRWQCESQCVRCLALLLKLNLKKTKLHLLPTKASPVHDPSITVQTARNQNNTDQLCFTANRQAVVGRNSEHLLKYCTEI